MVGVAVGGVVLLAFLGLYRMMGEPIGLSEQGPAGQSPVSADGPAVPPATGPVTPDTAVDALVDEALADEATLDEEAAAAEAVVGEDSASVSSFDQVYDENEF